MTKIEWTDKSWNLLHGCTKVSPGCANCYAERFAKRLGSCDKYDGTIKYFLDRLEDPLHWKRPRMVFVNSMSDLFHENVPFETIEKVFDIMGTARMHIFQVLTKRPERLLEYVRWQSNLADGYLNEGNVWLGVSVESPEYLHRIETLLQIPAVVRFVSFEPLLEDMGSIGHGFYNLEKDIDNLLAWTIIGCESGPKRRPCKLEWVYDIVNLCKKADMPIFVKQLDIDGKVERDINKFPKELQYREFPKILNQE